MPRYLPRIAVIPLSVGLLSVGSLLLSLLPCRMEASCGHMRAAFAWSARANGEHTVVPVRSNAPDAFLCVLCHTPAYPMAATVVLVSSGLLVPLTLRYVSERHATLPKPPTPPPPQPE